MASFKERWYKMPKGPDGKRHRVWYEAPTMSPMMTVDYFSDMEFINLMYEINPLLGVVFGAD
jgi:hypothetical protein